MGTQSTWGHSQRMSDSISELKKEVNDLKLQLRQARSYQSQQDAMISELKKKVNQLEADMGDVMHDTRLLQEHMDVYDSEGSKESSVVLGTPHVSYSGHSSAYVSKHKVDLSASPERSAASEDDNPAQTTDRQSRSRSRSRSRSPPCRNEQATHVFADNEMDASGPPSKAEDAESTGNMGSREKTLYDLFGEAEDSTNNNSEAKSAGVACKTTASAVHSEQDRSAEEEEQQRLRDIAKGTKILEKIARQALSGKQLVAGPSEIVEYPCLFPGPAKGKGFICINEDTRMPLMKYMSSAEAAHAFFLDTVSYADENKKDEIRCALYLALFFNLCPKESNASFYIDRALVYLEDAVLNHHKGLFKKTHNARTLKKDVFKNKLTLFKEEKVIEEAKKLFYLLEGSDSLCAALYEEEKEEEEEELAAKPSAMKANAKHPTAVDEPSDLRLPTEAEAAGPKQHHSMLFHNVAGKPVVRHHQNGFEREAPVYQRDDKSESSGAGSFGSHKLAESVSSHFRKEYSKSGLPNAPSAHGIRLADCIGLDMKLVAKGGDSDTSTSDTTTSDTTTSDTSDTSDTRDRKQTEQGMLLRTFLREQGELQSEKDSEKAPSQSIKISGLTGNEAEQEIMDKEYYENQKKRKRFQTICDLFEEAEAEEDEVMQQGCVQQPSRKTV